MKPVILAVVVQAIWGLAPKAAKTGSLRVLGSLAAVLSALGANELAVLLGAGVLSIVVARVGRGSHSVAGLHPLLVFAPAAATAGLAD